MQDFLYNTFRISKNKQVLACCKAISKNTFLSKTRKVSQWLLCSYQRTSF